jgi:hypothetical protein
MRISTGYSHCAPPCPIHCDKTAALLCLALSAHFPQSQIMDIDNIEPGLDFIEVIQKSVSSCDVLIAEPTKIFKSVGASLPA